MTTAEMVDMMVIWQVIYITFLNAVFFFFAFHYREGRRKWFIWFATLFLPQKFGTYRPNEPVLRLKVGKKAEEEVEELGGSGSEDESEGEESDGVSLWPW